MIWYGNGKIKMEKNEPALRSCWKCNPAHEYLKAVNTFHVCFECGRGWIFDRFADTLTSEGLDNFLQKLGMKEGESTSKIDAGYRVVKIEIRLKERIKGNPTN